MEIRNKIGSFIHNVKDWEGAFKEVDHDPVHWRVGYSAQSLAAFFSLPQGDIQSGSEWLQRTIATLLGVSEVNLTQGEIEHPSKVDTYRGGQRMQDMAIWGHAGDRSLFVGVEAKVLEEFDSMVPDAYQSALDYRDTVNSRSMKYKRVENLVDKLFPGVTPTDKQVKDMRYQLFHYLVASAMEGASHEESNKPLKARKHLADIVVLPVLVFRTPHYEEDLKKATENKKDFERFFDALNNFQKLSNPSLESVYYGKMDGREIYVFYKTLRITNPGQ